MSLNHQNCPSQINRSLLLFSRITCFLRTCTFIKPINNKVLQGPSRKSSLKQLERCIRYIGVIYEFMNVFQRRCWFDWCNCRLTRRRRVNCLRTGFTRAVRLLTRSARANERRAICRRSGPRLLPANAGLHFALMGSFIIPVHPTRSGRQPPPHFP